MPPLKTALNWRTRPCYSPSCSSPDVNPIQRRPEASGSSKGKIQAAGRRLRGWAARSTSGITRSCGARPLSEARTSACTRTSPCPRRRSRSASSIGELMHQVGPRHHPVPHPARQDVTRLDDAQRISGSIRHDELGLDDSLVAKLHVPGEEVTFLGPVDVTGIEVMAERQHDLNREERPQERGRERAQRRPAASVTVGARSSRLIGVPRRSRRGQLGSKNSVVAASMNQGKMPIWNS